MLRNASLCCETLPVCCTLKLEGRMRLVDEDGGELTSYVQFGSNFSLLATLKISSLRGGFRTDDDTAIS